MNVVEECLEATLTKKNEHSTRYTKTLIVVIPKTRLCESPTHVLPRFEV